MNAQNKQSNKLALTVVSLLSLVAVAVVGLYLISRPAKPLPTSVPHNDPLPLSTSDGWQDIVIAASRLPSTSSAKLLNTIQVLSEESNAELLQNVAIECEQYRDGMRLPVTTGNAQPVERPVSSESLSELPHLRPAKDVARCNFLLAIFDLNRGQLDQGKTELASGMLVLKRLTRAPSFVEKRAAIVEASKLCSAIEKNGSAESVRILQAELSPLLEDFDNQSEFGLAASIRANGRNIEMLVDKSFEKSKEILGFGPSSKQEAIQVAKDAHRVLDLIANAWDGPDALERIRTAMKTYRFPKYASLISGYDRSRTEYDELLHKVETMKRGVQEDGKSSGKR